MSLGLIASLQLHDGKKLLLMLIDTVGVVILLWTERIPVKRSLGQFVTGCALGKVLISLFSV